MQRWKGWAMRLQVRDRLISFLGGVSKSAQPQQLVLASERTPETRSMPGQALERARYLYAYGPDCIDYLVQYAMDAWVYTAVSEIATDFAMAPLEIWHRNEPKQADNHALLEMLGPAGRPNADQDRFEFLEAHASNLILTGQSYWYWYAPNGGAPVAVYHLPPEAMFVQPGGSEVVGHYVLRWQGDEIKLNKENVTHYRKYHPLSRYYGLGAMEALRLEVQSDRSMAQWNAQYFGDDVFAPAGILVVSPDVSDKEKQRLEDDLEGKHGPRRRTAVVRSQPGATVWLDAGLKQRDLDFVNGRLLSRQAIYEAVGLPLGLYSESSTEAHARVAERLKLNNVYKHHVRTAVKISSDVLWFWPQHQIYEARFHDVRQVDWQMEAMKLKAVSPFMTKNEVRERHLGLSGMEGGDETPQVQPVGQKFGQNGGSDDSNAS